MYLLRGRGRRGSVPVEYALLAALIGGALTGFAGVGSALATRFTQTAEAVSAPAVSGTSTSPGNGSGSSNSNGSGHSSGNGNGNGHGRGGRHQ